MRGCGTRLVFSIRLPHQADDCYGHDSPSCSTINSDRLPASHQMARRKAATLFTDSRRQATRH